MRLALLIRRLGPYHLARFNHAGRGRDFVCIEGGHGDAVYDWKQVGSSDAFRRVTLFPEADSGSLPGDRVNRAVADALDRLQPDVVAIPGWEDNLALSGLLWAISSKRGVVLMSDSNQFDAPRLPHQEWVKRKLIAACSAGFVAGRSATDYLTVLGMDGARIETGYDVVDNEYFSQGSDDVRQRRSQHAALLKLPNPFFLASARFIRRKNLQALITAYAAYRAMSSSTQPGSPLWDLVILGDGPLRGELEALIRRLGLQAYVHLPGSCQYGELPSYYGLASLFVHASQIEQWGLVVNEAMAAGLPVVVSSRCGCVPDLVRDNQNGFCFNPEDTGHLASLMAKMAAPGFDLGKFGGRSREIISEWSLESYSCGLWRAAATAQRVSGDRLRKRAVVFPARLMARLLLARRRQPC